MGTAADWSLALSGLLVILAAAPARSQEIDAASVAIAPQGFRPEWLQPSPWLSISASVRQPMTLSQVTTDDVYASVGRGFNPVTNSILDIQCVKPVDGTEAILNGTIPEQRSAIVDDMKSFARVSGSSFSAGAIIKSVSLGFGTSNSQGDYFNGADTFVRLWARVATEGKEWRDVIWTDQALNLLKSNIPEFVNQCGTRYVRAVFSGHLLDATVHFQLLEDKRTSSEADQVSVGVGKLFGLSAGDTSAETNLSTHASAYLWSQGRGALALSPPPTPPVSGPPATGAVSALAAAPSPAPSPGQPNPNPGAPPTPNPPTPNGTVPQGGVSRLIDWYNNQFVAAVQKAAAEKKSALPLYVLVENYSSKFRLQYRLQIPTLEEDIAQAVADTSDDYANLVTLVSTADYATETHPDNSALFMEDKPTLAKTAAAAKAIFKSYSTALTVCSGYAANGSSRDAATMVADCKAKLAAALAPMAQLAITRKYQ